MRDIADAGSRYATLGLAPLSGNIPPWLRWVRRLGNRFYTFKGLRNFKEKLRPNRWEPIFLCYPPGQNTLPALFDAASAFAPEGPARFAAEALVRTPDPALKLLTALLVPWMLLLATPLAAPFFPSEAVRWSWVAFDVGLLAFLIRLTRRWTHTLAAVLATIITADAGLTLLQAVLFNVRRASSLAGAVAIGVGLLGPITAAVFLWSAWLNHRRREGAPT
jgi:phosphatidylglycerol lysyltransferase